MQELCLIERENIYYFRGNENIIIIGNLTNTHQIPIRDPSQNQRRPIRGPFGDWHAWSKTHRRLTCLIRDQSETDMSDRRPFGDQYAWSETAPGQDIISYGFPMWHVSLRWVSAEACWSPKRHVCPRWGMSVSDEAIQSPMGLRWGMSVSDGSLIGHAGLWGGMSVSDGSPMRHIGLWWVSDQAYWSLIRLQSGMLVSDGSPQKIVKLNCLLTGEALS